jgi:hypothetical protein
MAATRVSVSPVGSGARERALRRLHRGGSGDGAGRAGAPIGGGASPAVGDAGKRESSRGAREHELRLGGVALDFPSRVPDLPTDELD